MIETRYTPTPATSPVRVTRNKAGKSIIVGYASVFHRPGEAGTEYELWPGVKERIGRNAFARAIAEKHDARGLFNHDPSLLLGRVGAGTVRLSVDSVGLRYEIDTPDTQAGRDVRTSLERGDLAGSSFAFIVRNEQWQMGRAGSPDIRTILDLDLLDVSPVTFPAYEAATAKIVEAKSARDAALWDRARQNLSAPEPDPAWKAEQDALCRDIELMELGIPLR